MDTARRSIALTGRDVYKRQAVGRTDPASDSAVLVLEGSGTVVYADDAESTLTAEQERLLLSFFDRWYQSLAQLEAEDLSEFFCDSHQADYSAAALDLQVGIRQAQPLDYTLTGYSFVLEVESCLLYTSRCV